jgi:hypothetical protein
MLAVEEGDWYTLLMSACGLADFFELTITQEALYCALFFFFW